MTTRVAVVGATGRLGRTVCAVVEAAEGFELSAQLNSRSSLSELEGADLVVDVSLPAVSAGVVEHAIRLGAQVLVGTSGWSAERLAGLTAQLGPEPETGVVVIPNFSVGSVVASTIAATAARHFDSIEIIETHHAGKVDSPSGTAVRTAEMMAAARDGLGPVGAPHVEQRARGELIAGIPIHSLRLDGVLAQQQVRLGGTGESLTITHDTVSTSSYEAGIGLALRAARDARGVTVGLDRLLGLTS